MSQTVRVLEWYGCNDRLVGVAEMPNATLRVLQDLFDVHPEDPMFDLYPVGPTQAPRISVLAGVVIDLNKYSYFVTAFGRNQPDKE